MSIGERLKEERLRLGFNQADFAALASTTKKSQIEYEKGATFPNAAYLAAVAQAGTDVQFVVTGIRSAVALMPDERLMLDRYRQSPQPLRDAALRVLLGAEPPGSSAATQNFHGSVSGQVSARDMVVKIKK